MFAEVDGPRGPIQIFCAHLSWSADHSAVRQEQTREIARFLTETRPRPFPAVLCGDLNSEQSSDELRLLTGRAASPLPHVVLRDAWEAAGNRRSRASRGRTPIRSQPRASISTAASTT